MGIRDRIAATVSDVGTSAVAGAAGKLQRTGEGFSALRAMFDEDERTFSIELWLVLLVAAVRDDEQEDERSRRDAYRTARSRRRRLGLLSFGAGPLVGVATQLVDLYCEVATVCDIADVHKLDLTERQIAAHLLVLWSISESLDEAQAAIDATGQRTVGAMVADRLGEHARGRLPEKLTKREAAKALWEARGLIGDARHAAGTGSVGGVVFAGHRTKQLIKRAEAQLGVGHGGSTQVRSLPRSSASDA
jgi:hypothetical protein